MFLNQGVRKIALIRTQAHLFQCACVKPSPKHGEIVSTTASICFFKVSQKNIETASLLTSPLTRYVRWITKKSILHRPFGAYLARFGTWTSIQAWQSLLAGAVPPSPNKLGNQDSPSPYG